MKQTIEVPWSIGDTGWALLERSHRTSVTCKECCHTSNESIHITEVRECEIDSMEINLSKGDEVLHIWYRVGFDIGVIDPECGRFTFGTSVPEIFATREEADAALDRKHNEY
jgi:hypothetical protein